MKSLPIAALAGLLATMAAPAAITLPDLIADHMVVQRNREIPVWGQATPGAEVKVEIAGRTGSAKAAEDGAWQVKLPPLREGGPHEIKISGDGEVTVKDVLVGDIWLSSGQSNLTFRMVPNPPWSMGVLDYEKEVAAANNPKLRFFTVITGASHQPEKEAFGIWQTTTPQNVRFISAISYFFAAEIQEKTGIPIGILVSGRGGTSIKLWMSQESLEKFPDLKSSISLADGRLKKAGDSIKANEPKLAEYRKKFREAIATTGKVPSWPEPFPHYETAPGALYNGMIAPLARVPVCGFIYCQGESDSQSASTYTAYFKELITSRRALFNEPDAPFLFVQIANFDVAAARKAPPEKFGDIWAEQRVAQAGALELSRTGMAVSADVGEALAVHPRDKKTVGHRLALAGRKIAYGEDIPYRGPLLESAVKRGGEAVLTFAVDKGTLTANSELTGFKLAGADGAFHPAMGKLAGNTVIVTSEAVPDPAKIRYAWANNPTLSLYDSNGLPCPPFEKDLVGN